MFITKKDLEEVVDRFINAITALTRANIAATQSIFELSGKVGKLTERVTNLETSETISVDLND